MRVTRVVIPALVMGLVISAACSAQVNPKERIVMRGGNLLYKGRDVFLRAIETPKLGDPATTQDEIDLTLIRAVEVGANSVCFSMTGYSPDGSSIEPKALGRAKYLIRESFNRRFAALCRVIPSDAPDNSEFRMTAARTAATALKNYRGAVYVFTGPDSAKLAEEFSRIAPDPITAAENGGAINLVTAPPASPSGKPVMLLGALPPADQILTSHFLLPDTPESYSKLDAAMANPAESAPWTPDNSVLSEQERADGFVSLFDGKTLNGWWYYGTNTDGFAVEDGAIVWKAMGGEALYSRERYDNFVLRLEWKINENGNSGIYLRAPRAGRQSKTGMEFQLQGDYGKPVDNQTTGSIYVVVPPKLNASKPCGEWNDLEIMLNGPIMKATLNGQVIQDLNIDDNPELKKRLKRGFIGLQDHARFVAFKNIRIKKL
ncbi:MAG TPA: DUF1080 domain-containing protein [Candidatus Bathyarchaeia archaeon]|nr:DUF1080 domain-containing protein [Candidatus Bathyarchaeia archaeon]